MDELDYDTRISAYETITVELFTLLQEDCAAVILSQCVHDLSSDLVLWQTASRTLISFIHFASLFLSNEMNSHEDMPSYGLMLIETLDRGAATLDASTWSRKQIQKIIRKFLLQNTGEAMNKELSVQKLRSTELDASIHKVSLSTEFNIFIHRVYQKGSFSFANSLNIYFMSLFQEGVILLREMVSFQECQPCARLCLYIVKMQK